VAKAKPSAELPSAETLLTYASILERLTDQAGFATGEIIEAACTALRHCAALRSTPVQAGADTVREALRKEMVLWTEDHRVLYPDAEVLIPVQAAHHNEMMSPAVTE
jgi:hypothetical protein